MLRDSAVEHRHVAYVTYDSGLICRFRIVSFGLFHEARQKLTQFLKASAIQVAVIPNADLMGQLVEQRCIRFLGNGCFVFGQRCIFRVVFKPFFQIAFRFLRVRTH